MRAPSVETAVLGDEAVLFDERTGIVHRLNHTAAMIWGLLDGRTDDEVARTIASASAVPVDEVRRDVDETIARFREAGLLVV